jgi:hypothetical protein
MPKRDFAQIAFDVVQRATGAVPPPPDPKASAVKGGLARAGNLSAAKRKAIAKKAANARWKN